MIPLVAFIVKRYLSLFEYFFSGYSLPPSALGQPPAPAVSCRCVARWATERRLNLGADGIPAADIAADLEAARNLGMGIASVVGVEHVVGVPTVYTQIEAIVRIPGSFIVEHCALGIDPVEAITVGGVIRHRPQGLDATATVAVGRVITHRAVAHSHDAGQAVAAGLAARHQAVAAGKDAMVAVALHNDPLHAAARADQDSPTPHAHYLPIAHDDPFPTRGIPP